MGKARENAAVSNSTPDRAKPATPASAGRLLTMSLAGVVVIVGLAAWYWSQRSTPESELKSGEQALLAGDVAGAYQHFERAATKASSPELHQRLAALATQLGHLDQAESWIAALPPESSAKAARLQLSIVEKAMELADAARVERLLRAIIDRDSQQFPPRQMLAHLYLLTLRQNELRNQISEIDRHFPDRRPDTNMLLLYCTGTLGQWLEKEPRAWLELAHQRDSGNPSIRAALAQMMIQSDDREGARALLAGADRKSGHWHTALVQVSDLLDTGKLPDAIRLVDDIEIPAWSDARFWVARGRVALEQSRPEVARTAFETAMRLDPFDPEPVYRLGRQYLKEGAGPQAEELLQRSKLLGEFNRTAKRAMGTVPGKGRKGELHDTAVLADRLGFKRLALLLFTALAGDFPELADARSKVAELRSEPMARQPLFNPLKEVVAPSLVETTRPIQVSSIKPADPSSKDSESTTSVRQTPRFTDVAGPVGLKFSYFRAPAPPGKPLMMNVIGGGIAVLDFDGDGWADLFFSQGTPLPVPAQPDDKIGRLFRNVRGEHYEEVTIAASLSDYGFGQGCAVADFDNDGFADLLVCHYGSLRLYRNHGDGTFHDATSASGLSDSQWSSSAAFGDFDRDGDLDLIVVHYVTAAWPSEKCCLPVEFPKSRNAIWENRGDGTFQERSQDSGILSTSIQSARPDGGKVAAQPHATKQASAEAYGLAVIVEDLDNDGWPDIYIANDMTPNFLFHNLGGQRNGSGFQFQEVGVAAGVSVNGKGEIEAGMGLASADADGNGYFDLFVTNFQEETNTFYRNHGDLAFSDDTARMGLLDLNPPKMGWGCQFLDTLGSGRLDLFFLNSHLKIDGPQSPSLFMNQGGRFKDIKVDQPYFKSIRMGRAVATFDWNRDLRPDLVAGYLQGNVSLLTNESSLGNRASLELVGITDNRDAESARIIVQSGKQKSFYRVSRGGGFLVANDQHLSIGLGAVREAHCEILWPNGQRQDCGSIRAGLHYRVVEGHAPVTVPDL